jgi:SAM-dependent methyltransferase
MVSDFAAFADMERSGWSDAARASGYVDLFAAASDQTIQRLLDAVGAKPGLRALDLCCGQGNVSAALIGRGCDVVGVDFSPAMLAFARLRAPSATFVEADAQRLPFADAEFDIVVSNLGLCHVPDPPRALAQARRMLGRGGRFAMTVWCGPDISPCYEVLYGAVKAHGSADVSVPQGPDFHQFARRDVADRLLAAAGFSDVELTIVDCAWHLDSPAALSDIFEKGTVRAAKLLASQPPANLAAIKAALAQTVRERFACGDHWRVPVPATLLRATA